MSGVCEPRHENGSMVHRAAAYHLFFVRVKLADSANTARGKLQQAFGNDAMSRAQAFLSLSEPLLKTSSAADDHQQHGQVTTQQW